MGWVSLASGEHGGGGTVDGESGRRVVVAAATTFLASLVGVPLSARALTYGRKFAVIATSACFVVCWSLKLSGGGWRVVGARVAAGLGGAGAYSVPPLIAREMCESSIRGAASSALILAHNLGFLVMYMAADFGLQHSTVLWSCLAVSAVHCVLFLLVPESPAYLAATGRHQEAAASLAWLRGLPTGHPTLDAEVAALPPPDPAPMSPIALFKDMLSDMGRRRAFIICFVAIVGQEACGVYTLMQFAERAFVLARDTGVESAKPLVNSNETVAREVSTYDGIVADALSMAGSEWSNATAAPGELASREIVLLSPARQAVILGKLLVWCGVLTALCLCAGGACAAWAAGAAGGAGAARWGAGAALAGAVGADSAGLQSAPYALLADMFTYPVYLSHNH
ncbi:unnamed protein product [Diatraea saccharalis]|uniref:Major facilitator superfamily (MFS) profile domain-containing protein n=1 Tax=Diatraea saccharalis TaxID=40085 RepID=A0A9N9RAM8_9NEOP|nr:unnamed protein product [Diatraea saccharalis]